jgi:polar amino acid transport system substrate-binding protein
MLAGIGFFGILSAELMSLLTTLRLNSVIQSSKDLSEKTVATVRGTTSVSELKSLGAFVIENDSIEESFRLLNQEKVTAVVFDAPVIRYYVKEGLAGTASIAGNVFADQYYGIALQEGSTLREPLNRAILEMRQDGTYERLYRRWFSDND